MKCRSSVVLAFGVVVAGGLVAGCDQSRSNSSSSSGGQPASAPAGAVVQVKGAGATFPEPLYKNAWLPTYNKSNPGVHLDYQANGSGAGITAITDQTVDFGASDAPMRDDELAKAKGKILHIPTVAGAVAIIYNLPDVKGDLKLDGETLAAIFMAQITDWSDPKITKLNPDLKLPSQKIFPVHRTDGSGTTFVFTDYLAKVSPAWAEKVGRGKSVTWPSETLGEKGNKGVAARTEGNPGAIGYVEEAYTKNGKLPVAAVVNKAGKAVKASVDGAAAAAVSLTDLPADLRVSITDAPGETAYPITGFTYLLVYDDLTYLKEPAKAAALVDFLTWCVTDGQKLASGQGYAPLPAEAQAKVAEKIKSIKK